MSQLSAPEQVTANGIRIVGTRATELAAQAATLQVEPPEQRQVLWAARFKARPRIGGGSPVPAVLQLLSEILRREWDACPALTRDTPFSRPSARFHGVTWDVAGEAGAWMGELSWRHRHPVLAGTPCTTHLLIEEQHQVTTLTLRSAADQGLAGVRGIVGAGQSRPALLDELRGVVTLTTDGYDGVPRILHDEDVEPFVRTVLLDEARLWPVAVLAPLEDGVYLVPPDQLAIELLGLAPLYVLARHSSTFRLTDSVGDRRLSAYWGALRVYRPEFTCADRSEDHWLLMRDRVDDPVERAALVGRLGTWNANRLSPVDGIQSRQRARAERDLARKATNEVEGGEVVAAIGAGSVESTPQSALSTSASGSLSLPANVLNALGGLPATMQELTAHLRDLSGTISHLVSANARLSDEIARLRTSTAIRASGGNALERRLDGIEALLRPAEPEQTSDVEETGEVDPELLDERAPTLVDVVRHAGTEYSDALLVLESAESTAADSPYKDADRVAAVLQAMAYVARRRQEGALDSGLRSAFLELGVDYRSGIAESTSEKLRRQYLFTGPDGSVHECHEHIALGAAHDPRHCLRIYFTSRAPSEPRFVVGHVGRHLTVLSSS